MGSSARVGVKHLLRPIVARLRSNSEDSTEHYIRDNIGLLPFDEYDDRDIFIVGYPKSGNTWFQNLIAGLVYGINTQYTPDAIIQELVPAVHRKKRYYQRFSTPMYFKSHHLPRAEYRRVIYLLRDGRDVMVSLSHHLAALNKVDVDLLELIRNVQAFHSYGRWNDHVEAWLANPYNAEILTIKYEDLLQDGYGQVKRVCQFVGFDRDDEFIRNVIDKNAFDQMQAREKEYGLQNPFWPKDKLFVRRGKIGSYQDEMSLVVQQAFLDDARNTMEKCGYL